MTNQKYHIIGGGIVGASIAYHLSNVTNSTIIVHEQGDLMSETTDKSLAFFGFYGDSTQYRMKQYAINLYNEFMANPHRDLEYQATGLLSVATTSKGDRELARTCASGTSGFGDPDDVNAQYLQSEQLSKRIVLPYLETDEVNGGLYRPQVGYVSSREFGLEFVDRARDNGVEFRENTKVSDIKIDGGQVTGIISDRGKEQADAVVSAAGPWNIKVASMLGLDIPVRHTLAPVLKLEPDTPISYSLPWITHKESGFSIRRNYDGTVLMTHHPVGGYENIATKYDPDSVGDTVPDELRKEGLDILTRLLPVMEDATVVDEWVGIRSCTPDENPVAGWTDIRGFSIAAFSTSGIQLSPAVGNMITRQLVDGEPSEYYDRLSMSRFEGYSDWREK